MASVRNDRYDLIIFKILGFETGVHQGGDKKLWVKKIWCKFLHQKRSQLRTWTSWSSNQSTAGHFILYFLLTNRMFVFLYLCLFPNSKTYQTKLPFKEILTKDFTSSGYYFRLKKFYIQSTAIHLTKMHLEPSCWLIAMTLNIKIEREMRLW